MSGARTPSAITAGPRETSPPQETSIETSLQANQTMQARLREQEQEQARLREQEQARLREEERANELSALLKLILVVLLASAKSYASLDEAGMEPRDVDYFTESFKNNPQPFLDFMQQQGGTGFDDPKMGAEDFFQKAQGYFNTQGFNFEYNPGSKQKPNSHDSGAEKSDKTANIHDHVATLGLPTNKPHTAKAVQKAYHKKALEFHPDKNPGNEEKAAEEFKKIGAANNACKEYLKAHGGKIAAEPPNLPHNEKPDADGPEASPEASPKAENNPDGPAPHPSGSDNEEKEKNSGPEPKLK